LTAALEIQDLRTIIARPQGAVQAVRNVSLTVDPGETVGLVGESGSGKTILGLSVMRLLPPGGKVTHGSIRVNGRETVGLPETAMRDIRGNDVGMIFQDPMTALNPTMTIGAQVGEPLRLHQGMSKRAASRRAAEMLSLVGLPKPIERLDDYPHQLSGGLRQRAMIATALICNPKVLVADEPTTALDVTIQSQILGLLDRLKSELDMGILLVTHDMGVIAGRADRVVVMYAGKVVEQGSTDDLFRAMHHPYTEALLASSPRPEAGGAHRLFTIPGQPPNLARPPEGCPFHPRCRYAMAECGMHFPDLTDSGNGHQYACYHPVNVGPPGTRTGTSLEVGGAGSRRAPEPELVEDAPLLQLDGVVKEYPARTGLFARSRATVKAVSNVSFTVTSGETFGLVGESGCGKTTLGRLMVELERLTSGTIAFDGTPITRLYQHGIIARPKAARVTRRHIQLMFQDPYSSLDPRMQVLDIVREPLAIHRIGTRQQQRARVLELLGEVGLPAEAARLYPHEFSGGQRQRIGLARALALEPRLLIADEPVSALDVSVQSQILNLLRDVQTAHGLTYVIISHDLGVIRYMSDRIGVMYLGKLVEIGPSSLVYRKPAHPYTAGLIEAIPKADPTAARTPSLISGELPSALDPPSGCRFRTRCPFAQDICASMEPPLTVFGPEHSAACHFPLQKPMRPVIETRAGGENVPPSAASGG
jgi:peptide/nickel transport system ATP-binding protein